MNKFLFAALLLSSIGIISCSKNTYDTSDGKVLVRVHNVSPYDYEDVLVKASAEKSYGNIKSGKKSDYIGYSKIYQYAYIELSIDGQKYILQPIDFVGETPLKKGKYTFMVGVHNLNSPYGLTHEFKED